MIRIGSRLICKSVQQRCVIAGVRQFGSSSQHHEHHEELSVEEKKKMFVTRDDIAAADDAVELNDIYKQDPTLYSEELDGASLQGRSLIDKVRERITGEVGSSAGYHLDNVKYQVNLDKPEVVFESEEEMHKYTDKYGLFDKHDDHHDDHHKDHHDKDHHDHDDHHEKASSHDHHEDHHDDHHDHHQQQEETYTRGFFLNRDGKGGVDFNTPFFMMFAAVPIYYLYSNISDKYKPQPQPDFAINKQIYLNQHPELRDYNRKLPSL